MSIKNQPKVSIIMGIYNCENTLEEAIKSIINQTYKNWELIMCDDCSKDNTLKIAESYAKNYPENIKVIKNERNLTLGPTLNRCLELATGDYIARQDGDDLSKEDRLEKQVKFLESNKEFDLVGTSMISFDENGEYGSRNLKSTPEGKDLMYGSVFAQGYKGHNLEEALYYVREDRDAYKRKSIKRRVNEIKVMVEGCKMLKLPLKYYLMVVKPIIATIVPQKILMNYHRRKFMINDNSL